MQKIKLQASLYQALMQVLKDHHFDKEMILKKHATQSWLHPFEQLNQLSLLTLSAAFVNGFEYEEMPEEKAKNLCYTHETALDVCKAPALRRAYIEGLRDGLASEGKHYNWLNEALQTVDACPIPNRT